MKEIVKKCNRCQTTKTISNFYLRNYYKKKKYYDNFCKRCARTKKTRNRDKEYQKRKRLINPKIKKIANDLYRKNNKIKIKAHKIIHKYIKQGIIKAEKCRDCDRLDTHAHHPDYTKPLKIIWLCPIHHKLEHLDGSLIRIAMNKIKDGQ